MSSIGTNSEDLVLNADGGSSEIKLKIDGTEKASISSAGAFTSTTIDATKLTGALPAIDGSSLTGAGPTHTSNASAPGSPSIGDFWHDTTNEKLYIRTNDGTSDIWMQI